MTGARLVYRVVARDEALLRRLQLSPNASDLSARLWLIITHSGGAVVTLFASLAPLWLDGSVRDGARRSTILLVLSHLLVQLIKRTVSRPRPVANERQFLRAPDRFSFPSGHAAAALSVAVGYASVSPQLAAPLLGLAAVVGASRVVLGVHFPADVLAGQLIALITAAAFAPIL
jgi:undecaprenyl-diphosphatase